MYSRSPESRKPETEPQGWRSREGQVLVMFAAGLMLLLGMVALAVDGGFIMAEKRQAQSAADAGAMAAAKAKLDYLADEGNSQSAQVSAGKNYASENAGTSEDNVDVDTSPPLGDEYVEVTVSKDVTSFFLRALYDGEWGVSAEAIAGIEPVQIPYALVALGCGPGGNAGIEIDGGGTIDVNEGSIMSNCGINASGSSNVVTAEGSIDAHGSIQGNDNWSAGQGINENRPEVSDPVAEAGVQPPSESAARAVNEVTDEESMRNAVTNLGSQTNPYRCPSGETCEMEPGYYGGSVSGLNVHGTLIMKPGIYYFGDNFHLEGQSGNTTFEGTDVLLYFADNARFQPKHARIALSHVGADQSECEPNLDAMVLWIDNGTDFLMQSSGHFALDGVIYAPESRVRLFGGPESSGMQVIVKSLELAGGNSFDILYKDCFDIDRPHVFLVQ